MKKSEATKEKELDLLIDEVTSIHHKSTTPKKINTGKINMNKDQYKKAKNDHKIEIAKIKAKRAELKNDIKKHKLLIKQSKIMYKLSKLKES